MIIDMGRITGDMGSSYFISLRKDEEGKRGKYLRKYIFSAKKKKNGEGIGEGYHRGGKCLAIVGSDEKRKRRKVIGKGKIFFLR